MEIFRSKEEIKPEQAKVSETTLPAEATEAAGLKQNEVVREQAVEKNSEFLTELELRELTRSEQPINQEGTTKKNIETLRPWHNYSIVMLENPAQIRIYDENGLEVKDFKEPLSNASVTIDLENITRKAGKEYLGNNSRTHSKVLNARDLPPLLRGIGLDIINKLTKNMSEGSWALEANKIGRPEIKLEKPNVQVFKDGKYVLIGNKNEAPLIFFITENDAGIVQAPRNWKIINLDSKTIPDDLQEHVKALQELTSEYRDIANDKYAALVTDAGINIVDKNKINDGPLFSDNIPGVERNIIADPSNPSMLYYCRSHNPREIFRLDLSAEPNTWAPITAELPKKYDSINNLQFDPSGNFFLFYSKEDLVIITKNTLAEVKKVPNLTQVNFDETGRVRAVDKDGCLVIYEPNFSEMAQELDKRRVAKLVEGIKIKDIFDLEVSKKAPTEKGGAGFKNLEPLRAKYEQELSEVLSGITTHEGVQQLRQPGLKKINEVLKQQGLNSNEVAFIVSGLEGLIEVKEKEFAAKDAREALALARAKLASGLSIASVSEARAEMEKTRGTEALLEEYLRQEVRAVALELEQRSLELFRQRGGEIIKDIHGLIERTKTDLEGFTSKSQMDDWLEFRYPQLRSKLGSLAKDVPLEADEAYKAIVAARAELQTIASAYEDKFKREYAKVREKASERLGATVNILAQDVDGLIERLGAKGFTSQTAAEQYLAGSEAKKILETEIAGLALDNPDAAKELERGLKVRISNALTAIERGALTQVAKTGQQMVMFGQTAFPKWEAKVKEKAERKVDVTFEEDAKTHGPGVKAGDILGDVSVSIRTSTGQVKNIRLYEGWPEENEWRLGLLTYRGEAIPPSYVTAADYKTIKKEYSNWSQGERSQLQKELQEKRDAFKEIYSRRQKIGKRTPDIDGAWQEEYKAKLQEYSAFVAERHIPLLKRIDRIKAEPEIEYTNGKGFIPKWQNEWVRDEQTEKYLEEMALFCKKQLDTKTGLLMLRGHAGSGKDVLADMFCEATGRPKFTFNCTKWTAEADLSEDWTLEAHEGATQAIKIPSALLSGIQTPGAVIYLNEFRAMPIPAQIFLHSLADAKREMVLKSESGRVIKALPTVLLMASENPGYPETFKPQYATESRFDILEVDYPPLEKKADTGDPNQNPLITSSEASRIARSVNSLIDFTLEKNLQRSTFDDVWDSYINGIKNNAPELSQKQKFDVDVILALVQFSDKLREAFMNIFGKTRDAGKFLKELPATQPVTGREMRSCAWWLDQTSDTEKATANPEKAAKEFLEKSYLRHIEDKEDRRKILNAMNIWTSKKRVRV